MPEMYNVAESIRHPSYSSYSKYNDIGLLRLDRNVIFNAFIRPACLPDPYTIPTDNNVIASGWGYNTTVRGTMSDTLMKVKLDLYTHEQCDQESAKFNWKHTLKNGIDSRSQFCAGDRKSNKNTCQVTKFA